MRKGAEPMTYGRTRRNAAPNCTAEISQRLAAALYAGDLDRPCGRACVETRFSETLQNTAQVYTRKLQGQ